MDSAAKIGFVSKKCAGMSAETADFNNPGGEFTIHDRRFAAPKNQPPGRRSQEKPQGACEGMISSFELHS
jgi:hypothetical protein